MVDFIGAAVLLRAWQATTGGTTNQPFCDDSVRALLCAVAVATVAVVCNLATVAASFSTGGPAHAWSSGLVPPRYAAATITLTAQLPLHALFVYLVLVALSKRGSATSAPGSPVGASSIGTAGSSGVVAALSVLLPQSIAGTSAAASTVVQNGVLMPRNARPQSSLVPAEGRRLGTV